MINRQEVVETLRSVSNDNRQAPVPRSLMPPAEILTDIQAVFA
jgi:hypothetical protein